MRHLFFLFDGTDQFAAEREGLARFTNIYKLNLRLGHCSHGGDEQIVFYTRGLGTGDKPAPLEAAFASGIWQPIEDAYVNLCSNYRKGDKVYLFGYSRGAIVARAVAGMLSHGLLKPESIDKIMGIRKLYALDTEAEKRGGYDVSLSVRRAEAEGSLKVHMLQDPPKIDFLGLFDSVVGGYKFSRELQEINVIPGTLAPSVSAAVHLLAVDEARFLFKPSAFFRMSELNTSAELEQIWLPGVHSDIGGGGSNKTLSDISLLVMIDRLLHHTKGSRLQVRTDDLISQYIDAPVRDVSVLKNEGIVEAVTEIFVDGERDVHGYNACYHPIAEQMAVTEIDYKGEVMKYPTKRLQQNGHSASEYFRSELLRGKEIQIAPRNI
jgi:uncharacterized protein (DUF2235 family)